MPTPTILEQKVQILLGERGQKDQQAVRFADLGGLIDLLNAEPRATIISAAPTVDQYNALVNDIQMLYRALALVRQRLLK